MGSVRRAPRTGRWEARYRDPSGRQRTRTFHNKSSARAFLATVEVDMRMGEWRDPRLARITFESWVEEYLASAVHKRATTMARDRVVLGKHFLPALGRLPLSAITPLHVARLVEAMGSDLAPKTVRTNVGVLRAVMSAAVDAGLLPLNPCRRVRLPAENRSAPRFLSVGELQRLAEARPIEYRAMVYVGGVLGLRWSEVAGLRLGRIDFERRTLQVVETVAEVEGRLSVEDEKTRASRATLPVPPRVAEVLVSHVARSGRSSPEDLVFQSPDGGPVRAANFRLRVWRPAVEAAGLVGLTFHGLRHSAAGLMIELGAHPKVIQERLRHASIRTTLDVYGSVLPGVDDALTQSLDDLLAPECGADVVQPEEREPPG